jgi:squalene-hopene/tetraprenyl-beta-curcumene cyclase
VFPLTALGRYLHGEPFADRHQGGGAAGKPLGAAKGSGDTGKPLADAKGS